MGSNAEKLVASLTRRERQVFERIARGDTTRELAARLSISENTISAHRLSIAKKLKESSIARLVLIAVESGVIKVKKCDQ